MSWLLRGFPEDAAPGRVVFGSVDPARIRLTALVPGVQNSWRPTFKGRLEEADGASRLIGRIGTPLVVRVFMYVWIGLIGSFGIVLVGAALWAAIERRWDDAPRLGLGVLAAVGMLVFFFALASFATRAGTRDEQWLQDWLEHRLDAHQGAREIASAADSAR